jgi:predicted Fe-Mo cluster-binding NifX family protein
MDADPGAVVGDGKKHYTLYEQETGMKYAIPCQGGVLCPHFGHCEQFAILETDDQAKNITSRSDETPPPHEPGVLPAWLSEQGVQVIIAGGMGPRAQSLFESNGIEVVIGAGSRDPEQLVADHMNGSLTTGANVCDH